MKYLSLFLLLIFQVSAFAQTRGVSYQANNNQVLQPNLIHNTPTLTTPTIANFSSATHTHANAAGGGVLTPTAIGLTDPGADRILFWDDSTGLLAWLTIGSNLSITGTTLNATGGGGGSGDVTGPSSSTNDNLVRFDGITGKIIQDSSVNVEDDGDILTPGSVSAGVGSSVAGSFNAKEGTAPSLIADTFSIYSPANVAVGGLAFVLPSAAFSGILEVANAAGVMTVGQATAGTDFVAPTTTITVAGTANEITSSAGAQDLSANRTWTLSLPNALTFTGKTITGGTFSSPTLTTPTISGAITFPDNVEQVFNPGANNAGVNVGSLSGDPSAPANGAIWYDSTGNLLRARINGATVSLGAGGASTPTDVKIYTTPGANTWTNPAGGKFTYIWLVGGGGGGGSGRKGAAGSIRQGGGGGGGAAFTRFSVPTAILASTETVTVGGGGAGGGSITANDTDGANGAAGTNSTFGAWVKASGATAGGGGTSGAGGAAGGGAGGGEYQGANGGAASATGGSGANASAAAAYSAAGGGAGGGITNGDSASSGGNGNTAGSSILPTAISGGSGGSVATNGGTAGSATATQAQGGGGGGGGGGRITAGEAGDGSAGGNYGAGGGGGGAALNSTSNSGDGGAGGNGIVIVVTVF